MAWRFYPLFYFRTVKNCDDGSDQGMEELEYPNDRERSEIHVVVGMVLILYRMKVVALGSIVDR